MWFLCRMVFSFVSYWVRMSDLSWYILIRIALQFIAIAVAGSFNKSHLSQTVKSTVKITPGFFQTQWVQNKCYRDSQVASIAQLQYLTTNLTWADLTSADLAKSLTQNIARRHHRHPKKRGYFFILTESIMMMIILIWFWWKQNLPSRQSHACLELPFFQFH